MVLSYIAILESRSFVIHEPSHSITILVALAFVVIELMSIIKLAQAYKNLGGVIKDANDLALVKKIINLNMKFALTIFILLLGYIPYLAILVVIGQIEFGLAIFYLFECLVIPCLLSAWALYVEKRFKRLTIISTDLQLSEKYKSWTKQWNELRLRFKLTD